MIHYELSIFGVEVIEETAVTEIGMNRIQELIVLIKINGEF